MQRKDIKIHLVSDPTVFALTDVFYGYHHALKELKIKFDIFPWHLYRKLLNDEPCYKMAHSDTLIKANGYTHVLIIGGLNFPEFLLESLYHIKSIVVSTEDPHSSSHNVDRLDKIDYYFSNERSIPNSGRYKNVWYCPTAGSTHECGKIPLEYLEDRYKSDILFLGAMYPNRRKLLEAIIPLVERYRLNFKICGHVSYMPKSSPLWKYVFDPRTVPHAETVKYYNGAKVVINPLRDIHWNPRTKSQKNPMNTHRFAAESLNPRAYEVPLCQAFMMLEDTRPEAREVFTKDEVGFFSDGEQLISRLRYFLLGKGAAKREEMAFKAFKKVSQHHTYVHRLMSILDIICDPIEVPETPDT